MDRNMTYTIRRSFERAISILLVITFVAFDVAWAGRLATSDDDSCLAVPSLFKDPDKIERSRGVGGVLYLSLQVADYVYDGSSRGIKKLPINLMDQILTNSKIKKADWQLLDGSNLEKVTLLDKNGKKVDLVNDRKRDKKDDVILISYTKKLRKYILQVALRNSPSSSKLIGHEYKGLSDRYVVKIVRGDDIAEPIASVSPERELGHGPGAQAITQPPDDTRPDGERMMKDIIAIKKNMAYLWDLEFLQIHEDADAIAKGDKALDREAYYDLISRYNSYLNGNEQQKANADQYDLEPNESIVYSCMEFGLAEELNTYSGGLGILAGDHLRGLSDRYSEGTFVGIGLAWKYGYFRQLIDKAFQPGGEQIEGYPEVDFEKYGERVKDRDKAGKETDLVIRLEAPDNKFIYAKAWKMRMGRVELYLLDTDIEENRREDALHPNATDISHALYAANEREWRLKQEYLLGIGGMRLLEKLGIRPAALHINEGHAAFAAIEMVKDELETRAHAMNLSPTTAVDIRKNDPERARKLGISFDQAVQAVKARVGFTSHTPIPAGNEEFDPGLFERYFRPYCMEYALDFDALVKITVYPSKVPDRHNAPMANLSKLAIALSAVHNGVSEKGGEVSRDLYDDNSFDFVTNSIHRMFWQSPIMQKLIDARWTDLQKNATVPNKNMELLTRGERKKYLKALMDSITDAELLSARDRMKEAAVKHLAEVRGVQIDKDAFIIVIARRASQYKRLGILLGVDDNKSVRDEGFKDAILDKLIQAAAEKGLKLQVIFAGKAHPQDWAGKDIIAKINKAALDERWKDVIIFIPDYDIDISKDLTQVASVWGNNPISPMEASGTSGMKAAANGVPSVSARDGWMPEADPASTVFLFGKPGTYGGMQNMTAEDRRALDISDREEIVDLYSGQWRDQNTNAEKGILDIYRNHRGRWAERMRGTIYDFMVNFDMPRFIEDYERKMYLPLVKGGRLSGASPILPTIEGIISSVTEELAAKGSVTHKEMFELVFSKVPEDMEDMQALRGALEDVKSLSFPADGAETKADMIADAIKKARKDHGLSDDQIRVLRLALTGPSQGKGWKLRDPKVTELFQIVEGTVNNNRAKIIKDTIELQLRADINLGLTTSPGKDEVLYKDMTTIELREKIERALGIIENAKAKKGQKEIKKLVSDIKSNLNNLEADSIMACIIAMAIKAKHDKESFIIGLGKDWIPKYKNYDGSTRESSVNLLIQEIESLGKTLRSMGLDNVIIIHKPEEELADAILDVANAEKTYTKLSNILVLGASATLQSDSFAPLRSTDTEARAFLAAIDPSELKSYVDSHDMISEELRIRLMEMLSLALELAMGKEPPQMPIISSYDKIKRIVTFLPRAEPIRDGEIRDIYMAEKNALESV